MALFEKTTNYKKAERVVGKGNYRLFFEKKQPFMSGCVLLYTAPHTRYDKTYALGLQK